MLIVLKVWHTCCKSCLAETMYASPLHSVSSETSARQHWTIFQPTKNLFPIRLSKKMCIFRVFVTVHNMGPAPSSWRTRTGSYGLCKFPCGSLEVTEPSSLIGVSSFSFQNAYHWRAEDFRGIPGVPRNVRMRPPKKWFLAPCILLLTLWAQGLFDGY